MFSRVANTAFSSDIADELFPHIQGDEFGGDRSFVATARVLLTPHIPAGFEGSIRITFEDIDSGFDAGEVPNLGNLPAVGSVHDLIKVFNMRGPDNTGGERGAAIIRAFGDNFPEFRYDEKMQVFFEKSLKVMKCYAFVDLVNHNTFVYVEALTLQKLHALQSMLHRLTPWWWDGTELSDDEKTLLKSLCSRFADKVQTGSADNIVVNDGYVKLMQKYEPLYDFKGAKIRKQLPDFMKRVAEAELESVKSSIQDKDNRIEQYENEIASLSRDRYDLEIRLAGLRLKADSSPDEGLMDYFQSTPCIDLVEVSGTEMRFCVYTHLEWWDDEQAKYLVANRNGDMYQRTGGIRKDDYAVLMKSVFLDRTMKLRVCAAYRMDISCNDMRGISGFSDFQDDTYVPNAHIQRHGCTGNYKQQFRDALRNGEYIFAIETAITSARSMNFNDMSFGEMMVDVGNAKDRKVFEDADGNLYTAQEAIRRLKKAIAKEAKK